MRKAMCIDFYFHNNNKLMKLVIKEFHNVGAEC